MGRAGLLAWLNPTAGVLWAHCMQSSGATLSSTGVELELGMGHRGTSGRASISHKSSSAAKGHYLSTAREADINIS